MYPHRIQPITLNISSAQLHAHLLYAARFLQIPEGRAFLLFQLRRRNLALPQLCAARHAELHQPLVEAHCHTFQPPPAPVAIGHAEAIPPSPYPVPRPAPPPLDLAWPREALNQKVPVFIYEAYPADPILVSANLFEVFI